MARVFQRGTRWYHQRRDEAGRWVELPCRARAKTEAKAVSAELERRCSQRNLRLEAAPSALIIVRMGDMLDLGLEAIAIKPRARRRRRRFESISRAPVTRLRSPGD